MLLFFVFHFISSEIFEINQQTMKKFVLVNSDQVKINVENSDIFVHVQSHFFFGNLKFTIYNKTENYEWTINSRPKDLLMFSQSNITIDYSDSANTCQITIWVIESQKCSFPSFHSSGMSSANVKINKDLLTPNLFACFFFEFLNQSNNPKYSYVQPNNEIIASYLYINDDEMINSVQLNGSANDIETSKYSILSLKQVNISLRDEFSFSISAKSFFNDFADSDSVFKICDNYTCASDYIMFDGLKTSRKMYPWFWSVIAIFPLVLLLFPIIYSKAQSRAEASLFSSTRALLSQY